MPDIEMERRPARTGPSPRPVEPERPSPPGATTGFVEANGIDICYESMGDPRHPPMLLIMGLGVQLNGWEAEFFQEFADRGFHLLRYDQRDTGRSTVFGGRTPDLDAVRKGDHASVAYSLLDMADDTAALLRALRLPPAHVVGISMGGMVAQILAIRHPGRVASLCSVMSSTGAPDVGRAEPVALAALRQPIPNARDEVLEAAVERARTLRGGGFPFDEPAVRRRAATAYDRAHLPEGRLRQTAAVLAAPDRTSALRRLDVPALVIHGAADPLVNPSGGTATAEAIPGARLQLVPGMGHELPFAARPGIVDAVVSNTRRVHRT